MHSSARGRLLLGCRRMSGTDTLPIWIARVIRGRREQLGVSQEAFADQLGFHRAFFGRIENGQNMTLLTLQRVAEGLAIPVWQLVREAEEVGSGLPQPTSPARRPRKVKASG